VGQGSGYAVNGKMLEHETSLDVNPTATVVRLGGRLGELSLPRQVWVLAVWPLLEQVLSFFVGLTDLLVSGHMATGLEQAAILDAMGLGTYVLWFLNILQGAVGTGVMALVSRATGGHDDRLANRGLGQGLWLGLGAGLFSFLLMQVGVMLLIRWVGLGPAATTQAESYLKILAFSAPFSGGLFAINAALRGSGDTRTPFYSMIVVNGVNMALCWLLVFGPAPFGGHGVAGIGTATVISWVMGFLTCVLLVRWKKADGLHWAYESLRPHVETLRRILHVGAPQALEITGMWLIHAFGIRIISGLGNGGALGAHILAIRVESMSFLPGFAIGTAGAALAGQYLGAGSREMAVKAVRLCWKVAAVLMGTIGISFLLGRHHLIGWMAPGSDLHARLAVPLLVVCAFSQPFFATCIILKTSMRGAGATQIVLRWSFGSMFFYRVIVLWVLSYYGCLSLTGVWIVFTLDMITQAAIFVRLHFQGKWLDACV